MSTSRTIDVDELRVGMFIHLDVGWMSHPFPLSSFRISDTDQIAAIRELGLKRVRWCPRRSDAPFVEAVPVPPGPRPLEAHVAQREAQLRCERNYIDTCRSLRRVGALVTGDPRTAREMAEGLARTLTRKILGEGELSVRLLSVAAGERATAHAVNVAVLSLLLGRLLGLSEVEMLDLGTGALLHDIGKIDMPERVRHLDEGFTGAETALYREHVSNGVERARTMGLEPGALLVIAQHHEHADGSGFPQRLNADRMTTAARVVALVNRYDKLCNPCAPARALTPHEAVSHMFSQAQQKFDTPMLNAFIRMMGVYPPGSVVQLTDDRYAIVTAVNASRPLKPRVLVHDPAVPASEAVQLELEAASGLGIRRCLKPYHLPPAALQYFAPRQRITYFFEPAPGTER